MLASTTTPAAGAIDRSRFLEPSPFAVDCGNLIGRDPREMSQRDLRLLGSPTSPIKAVRAFCIDCSGGNAAEARKCTAVNCALWPMRMAGNPFHASSTSSKLQMANFATSSDGEGI